MVQPRSECTKLYVHLKAPAERERKGSGSGTVYGGEGAAERKKAEKLSVQKSGINWGNCS